MCLLVFWISKIRQISFPMMTKQVKFSTTGPGHSTNFAERHLHAKIWSKHAKLERLFKFFLKNFSVKFSHFWWSRNFAEYRLSLLKTSAANNCLKKFVSKTFLERKFGKEKTCFIPKSIPLLASDDFVLGKGKLIHRWMGGQDYCLCCMIY